MKNKHLLSIALALTLTLAVFAGVQFVAETSAKNVTVTEGVTPSGKGYIEIVGSLDDASYLIRFPDPIDGWNGMLTVYCHGWGWGLEPDVSTFASLANAMINNGFAFAASTFGEGGYPIQKAVIRTHQLTEYVIENYNVEGKVFLFGISMGGNIVLQLGAKYPELYSGVLDICGSKDLKDSYYKGSWANLDDTALTAELMALGPTPPPPPVIPFSIRYYPCTSLQNFRDYVRERAEDIAGEFGGTPEEKPAAYERFSPLWSAVDLKIPVITVHGTLDGPLSLSQSLRYQDAVTEAGHSDLYRLHIINGGGHASSAVTSQIGPRMAELVAWSDVLDPT